MVFEFLKKGNDVPPDIGKEERPEKKVKRSKEEVDSFIKEAKNRGISNRTIKDTLHKVGLKNSEISSELQSLEGLNRGQEQSNLEIEKLSARINVLESMVKAMNERSSNITESIGELRAMNVNNEKTINRATIEAIKTIEIVKEVKPEKLRFDYQRVDAKIQEISEKIESQKQFEETIMNEIKDIRRKAGIFIGTDGLLKLNDEVKKDLIELQHLGSKVKFNSDKSEQLFMEISRRFSDYEKNGKIVEDIRNNLEMFSKTLEKLKLDHTNVISYKEYNDYKKKIETRFISYEATLLKINEIKEENQRLSGIIETILSLERKNEESINDIALTIGDEHIEKVNDYDERFVSILNVVEEITDEINKLKNKLGIKATDQKRLVSFKKIVNDPKTGNIKSASIIKEKNINDMMNRLKVNKKILDKMKHFSLRHKK